MVRYIIVGVAVCALVGSIVAQTNYCINTYCTAPRLNVGCNPPPATGGPGCFGKSARVIDITAALQKLILDEHNTRRSQLALGNLASFAPASRMPTLTWDAELAKQAGNNARSCNFAHDQCRNTPVYSYAGQNIAYQEYDESDEIAIVDMIKENIDMWWTEYEVTSQAYLDKYPQSYRGPAIGHFTQMVSDQTNKVGCALQLWKTNGAQVYYFVCNYAVTNIIGRAVYKSGPVGSGCTTGRQTATTFNGLCSASEVVSPVPNAA